MSDRFLKGGDITYKGYKVRLFPTPEQEELLWKHIHACRFLWNYMIEFQEENYKNGGKYHGAYDLIRMLPKLKQQDEYKWLQEISNGSLQEVCRNVEKAYRNFFNHIKDHPRFKTRKKSRESYPLRQGGKTVYFKNGYVTIPNIKKVLYKTNYNLPQGRDIGIINPTISIVNNKWILSFSLEFESQERELNDYNMGIDLGIKELAVVAVGDQKIVYHNINKTKRVKTLERKLQHINRCITRKYKTNKCYDKTKEIIKYEKIRREIHYKLANIRKNYIHQITHELVSLKPKRVIMEDLDILGMMKNKHLSKAIANQCLYEFIRQMKYKCERAGIEFVQADRWFPSSKTCSQCGEIKKDLNLSDRVYKCTHCGLEIDRDYNAAINLMNYSCPTT